MCYWITSTTTLYQRHAEGFYEYFHHSVIISTVAETYAPSAQLQRTEQHRRKHRRYISWTPGVYDLLPTTEGFYEHFHHSAIISTVTETYVPSAQLQRTEQHRRRHRRYIADNLDIVKDILRTSGVYDSTNIFIPSSSDVISTVGNTSITDHLAGTNQRNNRRRTQQPSGGQAADKWQASRDQHNCVVLCFFSGPPQSGSPRCRRVGACVLL
ncbi:PREDICTED: uncharacterized protein LOC106814937 isoform X2 [Priapulus caudatus]|uniref:Uncharacterized protein LOC106814937 isoform X2 n=1 Tax=Priapulus caudatus TaxID=37621 RepID=A0ABM1ERJ0_PRICU|nr:PREDICTED: uncharacterized protein LOC106814937 isoform X2 [Priapulus caudatus]